MITEVQNIICNATDAAETMRKYRQLVNIYKFIDLPGEMIVSLRLNALVETLHAGVMMKKIKYSSQQILQLITEKVQPLEPFEQRIFAMGKSLEHIAENLTQPLNSGLLKKINDIYFHSQKKTENILFASIENSTEEHTENYQKYNNFFSYMEDENTFDPLSKSFIIFFYFLSTEKTSDENTDIAVILLQWLLSKYHLTLGGLISIYSEVEKERNEFQKIIAEFRNEILVKKGAETNFSKVVNYAIHLYTGQLENAKKNMLNQFRKFSVYEKLNPRLRNVVNYIFEYGHMLHPNLPHGVNERQAVIIRMLYAKGILQTKELFSSFEVSRKTIQRDFTELAEAGIVNVIGEGRGLKYTVPLSGKVPLSLQKFNTEIKSNFIYHEE